MTDFSKMLPVVVLSSLLPLTASRAADSAPVTSETIEAAEKVIGLQFTPAEREMMTGELAKTLRTYETLRKETFPNALSPAFVFNPLPHGFKVGQDHEQARWEPPANVKRPADTADLAFASVAELAALLRSQQITSEELTRLSLDRLKKFGPRLHCVITLTEELAMAQAKQADAELRSGKSRGPLHGIPYAAKDLLDTKGIPTTWGVSLHKDRIPTSDATVIRKLREAGAVLVAKTSLGELAMDDVWFGGRTRNPWNPEKGSSGSSAGSASAVAAGLIPFAIGSETLGSIVSPSNVCGTTGLRPTFGRVSRAGAMTLCWTLDKIGPLARSAEDCALVLDAIRGADHADPSTLEAAFRFTTKNNSLRVGIVKADFDGEYGNQANDRATLDKLRALGYELREVSWPDIPTQPLILTLEAEAAAAFDELTRSNQDDQLAQQSPSSWPNQFRAARFIPAVEYIQAMRLRTRLIQEMARVFENIDVIVAPSTRGRQLLYTNMAGYPCVVAPNGDKTGGKNASICFIGRLFGEADIVQLAAAYQATTDFHRQRPPLTTLLSEQ
jgi:Asp-tRNA(Asn)/Glu-tRNA(Gln) amidotransferase A subunit family amidase